MWAPRVARGQSTVVSQVQVRVRRSGGLAVSGAEVVVVRGLNEVVASATTNDGGLVAFKLAAAQEDYQLVARKVGFRRTEQFFRVTSDSLSLEVVLLPAVQALDAVVVTAEADIKRKSYHLDADDIVKSDRPLFDAADILAKLRPDMICGRSCDPLEPVAATTRNPARKCPGLAFAKPRLQCPIDDTPPSIATNVWVNGQRISIIAPDEVAVARQHGVLAGLKPGTMTVLSQIKPEHIAEMNYIDSMDSSVGKIGSEGGLFVVLKPGVRYEPGRNSYVDPELAAAAAARAARAATEVAAPDTLPAHRYRLLGVYDIDTGEAIEGADVIDMTTGVRARTTATGTVTLSFLPEGASPIRIVKPGYDELTMAVEISAATTLPLTLVLTKKRPD
jgi:hypothetical protein